MSDWIDLASDTATRPTEAMRQVMAMAPVGDDQRGEDPSVNELQEVGAALLGKPASLFVPSATMANQIALKVHTQPGDEVICHEHAHIRLYEGGAPAVLSGCLIHPLTGERGVFTAEQVRAAARLRGDYRERLDLINRLIFKINYIAPASVPRTRTMYRIAQEMAALDTLIDAVETRA